MDLEVARRREPFPANVALERFPSAVREHVIAEMFRPAEYLATQRALVHLLTGVNPVVPREVALLRKPFVANGAGVRPLTGVRPAVYRQQTLVLKTLPAFRALVPHPPSTRVILTLPGTFLGMLRQVALQSAVRHKAFATDRTRIGLLRAVRPLVNDNAAPL